MATDVNYFWRGICLWRYGECSVCGQLPDLYNSNVRDGWVRTAGKYVRNAAVIPLSAVACADSPAGIPAIFSTQLSGTGDLRNAWLPSGW